MKNLSKERVSELARLFENLDTLQGNVESAVMDYNDGVGDLNEVLREIGVEIESYMGERSEKWQESERSDQYEEWLSFFEEEKEEAEEPYFEHGSLDDVPLDVECV